MKWSPSKMFTWFYHLIECIQEIQTIPDCFTNLSQTQQTANNKPIKQCHLCTFRSSFTWYPKINIYLYIFQMSVWYLYREMKWITMQHILKANVFSLFRKQIPLRLIIIYRNGRSSLKKSENNWIDWCFISANELWHALKEVTHTHTHLHIEWMRKRE